jgi:hypothetical protein
MNERCSQLATPSGASPLPIAVTPDGTYLCLSVVLNYPEQLQKLELLFIDVAPISARAALAPRFREPERERHRFFTGVRL